MIPKTTTYKQFKEKRARDAAKPGEMEKGQRTLNGVGPSTGHINGVRSEETVPGPEEPKTSSPTVPRTPVVPVSALIADRTVEPTAHKDPDVEMKD